MNAPKPDEAIDAMDGVTLPDPKASYRLFQFGCGAILAICIWFIYQTGGDIDLNTCCGIGILILASLPALRWAARGETWFPAFEIGMLTCIAFYAIPLLSKHTELDAYPPSVITEASSLVLLYLAMANLGFFMVRNPVHPPRWARVSLLPAEGYRYIPVGLFLNTVYIYSTTFADLIPFDFLGTLRALFFGLGTLCTFILARQWGMGLLSRNAVIFVVVNLFIQIVFLFSHLYLISGISLVALAVIAYSATKRRLPWLFLAVFIPLIALLHLGKSEMRHRYWEMKRPLPGMLELPAYFTEWIGCSLEARANREEQKGLPTSSVFERASLIQMLCLCVDRVPSLKPHLNGESYVDIPAQVIPRALWPDKPSSLLANIRLALHFNLVSAEAAFTVSIAFGMIAEAYVNFGFIGVAVLGLLFGVGFKRVAQLAREATQFSALGILMILLTAWSFQLELILATWISSLFQAAVVCIGLPLVYRRFTTA